MARLTEQQQAVLRYLSRVKEYDGPPTCPEISRALGHPSYWAAAKVAALAKIGFAERLGASFSGGHCYRITDMGRDALSKLEGATP